MYRYYLHTLGSESGQFQLSGTCACGNVAYMEAFWLFKIQNVVAHAD